MFVPCLTFQSDLALFYYLLITNTYYFIAYYFYTNMGLLPAFSHKNIFKFQFFFFFFKLVSLSMQRCYFYKIEGNMQ